MKNTFNNSALILSCTASLLLAGCAAKVSNGTGATSTISASNSSTAATGALTVSLFSPATGSSLSAVPGSVVVVFSETNLDQSGDATAVNNASNYVLQCGSSLYYATGVTYNGSGSATVTLPAESVTADTTCSLTVSTAIMDTSGNALTGTNAASYLITNGASGGFSVSAFSPASETISSLPTSVAITFSETTLNTAGGSYSELNAANYSLVCNSSAYSVTSATLTSSGVVTLTLPSLSLSSGTVCTLTASASLEDASGTMLSAAANVTYTIGSSGYSSVWNEAATASFTSTVGGSAGSDFWDMASTGLAMSGINIRTGAYVDQITGIWEQAFNTSSSLYYGPTYGGTGGASFGNMMCPSGMQLTGLYGTYSSQIDSIGILCATETGSSTYQSAAIGGTGTSSFQISCPAGTFATDLEGSTGNYVQTLALGCR